MPEIFYDNGQEQWVVRYALHVSTHNTCAAAAYAAIGVVEPHVGGEHAYKIVSKIAAAAHDAYLAETA